MPVVFKIKQNPKGLNMGVGERRDISPEGDNGIVKELLVPGSGEEYPNYGDKVRLKYTAYYGEKMDKECVFDSSEKDGEKSFVYTCLKGN